jgi:protein TonB
VASALEVMVVNARSSVAPTKAQALAQANLAGGGEAEAGRATSPLPAAVRTELGDSAEDAFKKVDEMMETQQQLLAMVKRELATLPTPDPKRDRGTPEERAQEDRRRQLLDQLAEIERRIREENARPKKRFISPATKEVVYARYYDQLRRKIEERGTRNFPESQGKRLYGELLVNVTVNSAGEVINTEVMASSNNPKLDRQAVAIVRAASPFDSFGPDLRKKADLLEMTWRFRFTREDGLETTLSQNR